MASMMGSRGIRRVRIGSQLSGREMAEIMRRQLRKTTDELSDAKQTIDKFVAEVRQQKAAQEAAAAAKPWNRFKAWLRRPLITNISKRSGQR